MDRYRIQVKGDDGPESLEISGTIVGPFGVSEEKTNGTYRVTHLHSGLLIRALCSSDRAGSIKAAAELERSVPWWKSHKKERIAAENGLSGIALAAHVAESARMFGCEGLPKDE